MPDRHRCKCEAEDCEHKALREHELLRGDNHRSMRAAVLQLKNEVDIARARNAGGEEHEPGTLAALLHRQGCLALQSGAPQHARACWEEAYAACGEAASARQRAAIAADLGRLLLTMKDRSAISMLDRAITLLRPEPGHDGELAYALAARGSAARHDGDLPAAIAGLSEAAALLEVHLAQTRSSRDAAALAHALLDLGRAHLETGGVAQARESFATCVELAEALNAADPTQAARNILNAALNHLGHAEEACGRPERALPLYERSALDMRRLVDEGRADLADDLAQAEADLGRTRAAVTTH